MVLRPAVAADADDLAAIHLTARAGAPMPAPARPPEDVRRWLAGRIGVDQCWVAELAERPTEAGAVVAYARFTETWLDDLYVHPAYARSGIGGTLLDLVKALHPSGFGLWVFESNAPARAFYARHGLVERERTDGSQNEERQPDIRLEWPG